MISPGKALQEVFREWKNVRTSFAKWRQVQSKCLQPVEKIRTETFLRNFFFFKRAVIGGLVGAVQVYAGLTQVNKVGAGPFMGFTVTAALLTSLLIDHFGWFRMDHHPLNVWRGLGGLLLVAGVTLIAKF